MVIFQCPLERGKEFMCWNILKKYIHRISLSISKSPSKFLLLAFVLTHCSCATIFNSQTTSVTIKTSKPVSLTVNKDTVANLVTSKTFSLKRDNKPLVVTASSENLAKTVFVKSKNSLAYWLNLYPNLHLWSGFYIDTKTKKRYTYPKTIYIDLDTVDSSYSTYRPIPKTHKSSLNIFKITPLKVIGLTNPSIETVYERRTGNRFSTQLMASYLLPNVLETSNDFSQNVKGFRLSVEEKFYVKKSAPYGPYLSLEFDYLNNRYNSISNFEEQNGQAKSPDNFEYYSDVFGIKKQTYNLNFKLGHQLINRKLVFDFYAGLGLRYKNTRHFDRINPDDKMEMPRHPNVYYMANLEGKRLTISLPLNARIGWRF